MVRALTPRTVGHCAQEVRCSIKTRRAILVTWNPDKFVWGGGYLDAVEQTAQGIGVVGDWSTGNRTGGGATGGRVLLLPLGTQGRGNIASGTVLKDTSSDVHWDGSGRQANFVDLIWECV